MILYESSKTKNGEALKNSHFEGLRTEKWAPKLLSSVICLKEEHA